ncbi:MAG: hypothetical protein Q4E01_01070 [Actinomycetaceae bacterium]|nr:hypothetical protein [Actinomycetaceae bacterium]
MENHLISMSAVRSAMKVIYTPAITLASPIGLRNDPHTATILHMGQQYRTDFEGAVAQMTPFERRDYESWRASKSGEAYEAWGNRAFAMAAALSIVEDAFVEETDEDEEEAPVDPTLQRLVDLNWTFDTHGQWFLISAFIIGFLAFFSTGGMVGGAASTIRMIAGALVAVLVIAWMGTKLLPSIIEVRARRLGATVPTAPKAKKEVLNLPIWTEESSISSAKILNHANWVMLAQPGAAALMELEAPVPVTPTGQYVERQVKILEAAKRWREDSPLKPRHN